MGNPVGRWDFDGWGPPRVEAIRALHRPAGHYRISPASYPAGTEFGGGARAGRMYVLAGICELTVGQSIWELQAGDIVDFPEGAYRFRVLGSGPVELVSVWELPPEAWSSGDDSSDATTDSTHRDDHAR